MVSSPDLGRAVHECGFHLHEGSCRAVDGADILGEGSNFSDVGHWSIQA